LSEKPVIILDMDETLLHTSDESFEPWSSGLIVTPRPGLAKFIQTVNLMGEVWVLSAGSPDYVPEALTAVDLHRRIKGWMSSQMWNPIKTQVIQGRPWVLVDDRSARSALTRVKLHQCGGNGDHSGHLVQVKPFSGDMKDRVLEGLPGLIGLNLGMQKAKK
jgi:hypothetical protein